MNWFRGKKTFIVSGLMAIASLVHLISGDLTFVEFVSSDHMMNLFNAMGLSALRTGIWQSQKDINLGIKNNIQSPHAG
jgi:hypothetical protein